MQQNIAKEIQNKTINFLITKGEKRKAIKILKESLKIVNKGLKEENNLSYILTKAVLNATPDVQVKTKRIGATIYQIPKPINQNKRLTKRQMKRRNEDRKEDPRCSLQSQTAYCRSAASR